MTKGVEFTILRTKKDRGKMVSKGIRKTPKKNLESKKEHEGSTKTAVIQLLRETTQTQRITRWFGYKKGIITGR